MLEYLMLIFYITSSYDELDLWLYFGLINLSVKLYDVVSISSLGSPIMWTETLRIFFGSILKRLKLQTNFNAVYLSLP